MVLKVFITTGDEISLQFWLLSINHTDPLWTRLCVRGDVSVHAFICGIYADKETAGCDLPPYFVSSITSLLLFQDENQASAIEPMLLGGSLRPQFCTTSKTTPDLLSFLLTEVASGSIMILLPRCGWIEETSGYYLLNPVAVLLGACLKKCLDNFTKTDRKGCFLQPW